VHFARGTFPMSGPAFRITSDCRVGRRFGKFFEHLFALLSCMRVKEFRRVVACLGRDSLSFLPLVILGDPRSIGFFHDGEMPFFSRTMVSAPAAAGAERGGAAVSYLDATQGGAAGTNAQDTCDALRTAAACYMLVTRESLRGAQMRHMQGISALLCQLAHLSFPLGKVPADLWSEDSLLSEVSRAAINAGLLRDLPAVAARELGRVHPLLPRSSNIAWGMEAVIANHLRANGWGAWIACRTLNERVRILVPYCQCQ